MQVRVIPIAPADEVPQLSAVAVLGLFRTRAGALLQESLQEELVPPQHRSGLSGIEQAADIRQGLRLIQPSEDRWDLSGSVVWMVLGRLWRNSEIASGEMVEGGLPPPSSHLGDKADFTPSPLMGQAATGAA